MHLSRVSSKLGVHLRRFVGYAVKQNVHARLLPQEVHVELRYCQLSRGGDRIAE